MIQKNISLKAFNTFGIDVNSKYFISVKTKEELIDVLSNKEHLNTKKLILGGGSNLLLLNDFEGLVIKIEIGGFAVVHEDENEVNIQVGAGVMWHDLVLNSIDNGWAGLENLSLIPGTVGAAPMQNIGAYGVEIKDTFLSLSALNITSGKIETFDAERCAFGYRESYFKHEGKNRYVILDVCFKLSKKPVFKIEYGAIKDILAANNIKELSLKAISDAVIEIRQSKLPDPKKIGNSGSFFKNPEIPIKQYNKLLEHFPNMPSYKINDDIVKVPAGWLIEQAGWKGYKRGNIGVHEKQALVLVNYGGGKGSEIKTLSFDIQNSVFKKFGISINPEVNFIS